MRTFIAGLVEGAKVRQNWFPTWIGAFVKRLTAKRKAAFLRRQRRQLRRLQGRGKTLIKQGKVANVRQEFVSNRLRLGKTKFDFVKYPGFASFTPPKTFSLTDNFEESLAFILDFRRFFSEGKRRVCPDGSKRLHYADFAQIERIDAGAGLVLAAEVHRYAQDRGGVPGVHDHLWHENVRDFFVDAGLFDLLKIDPKSISTKPSTDGQRQTLKFTSGRARQGSDAKALIQELQTLAGRKLGPRPTVYNAIAEAFANVAHAYPIGFRTWPYRTSRQWWASGFWSPSSDTVGLQLYDQGAGIPATLPKQTQWPKVLKLLDREGSPSGLIAAALEYGRTSTGQAGRGKGLAEMADWIETTGTGFLRIISGGGEITYRPGGHISRRNFNASFCGTLVEWEVRVVA